VTTEADMMDAVAALNGATWQLRRVGRLLREQARLSAEVVERLQQIVGPPARVRLTVVEGGGDDG
jgi:hypothetical protein